VTDPDLLDFMMGHVEKRDRGAYNIFDPEYVRKEYARAEPSLTLMSDHLTQPYHNPSPLEERAQDRVAETGSQPSS
jgi:hypothetical protein